MTIPTNWPDPLRPGVPMFPERDGWHLLKVYGGAIIEFWSADNQEFDNHYDPDYTIYECACLTPAQISEMLAAERERCAREAVRIGESWNRTELSPINTACNVAHAIRNLGAAP